jgi:hypothetical protein
MLGTTVGLKVLAGGSLVVAFPALGAALMAWRAVFKTQPRKAAPG